MPKWENRNKITIIIIKYPLVISRMGNFFFNFPWFGEMREIKLKQEGEKSWLLLDFWPALAETIHKVSYPGARAPRHMLTNAKAFPDTASKIFRNSRRAGSL